MLIIQSQKQNDEEPEKQAGLQSTVSALPAIISIVETRL